MSDFLKQLWERKVVQFGAVYLGASWVLLQVAIAVEGTLELPGWVDQVTLVALGLGFPVALILAWAQESKVDRAPSLNEEGAAPAPKNADGSLKPTIAIMPFTNMSDDAEKEYFADGMTEDIINGLSLNQHLSIKSRTSTFAYKGQTVDIRQAARDLGVAYIVEGSIRPMGARIRISAQLIDAVSGDHLWSEKYDEPAEQLFDLQDEVINAITQTLGVQLLNEEAKRALAKTDNLTAWQFLHATNPFNVIKDEKPIVTFHRESIAAITEMLKTEPNFAPIHVVYAWLHFSLILNGWAKDPEADRAVGEKHLRKALALAPDDPYVLALACGALSYANRPHDALQLGLRALELHPNLVETHFHLGIVYALLAEFDQAVAELAKAKAGGLMASHGPYLYLYQALVGLMALDMDEFGPAMREAIARLPNMDMPKPLQSAMGAMAKLTNADVRALEAALREAVARMPGYELPPALLAGLLAMTGRRTEAEAALASALDINPAFTIGQLDYIFAMNPNQAGSILMQEALRAIWPKDIPAEEST